MVVGKVYLVGVGPGGLDEITPKAIDGLNRAQVVIGHRDTLKLVSEYTANKEIISKDVTPTERAKLALNKALEGKDVALVSPGDPGIFAIASTFFTYLKKNNITLPVEVIPGVTMANSAAALLGSPIGHDFAVISLSDRATPWSSIKRRLQSAAESDFVLVIYNPTGKLGNRRLKETTVTLKKYRKKSTPVGIVSRTNGNGQEVEVLTLSELLHHQTDLNSTLIIGNSETFIFNKWMITPRAYKEGVGY